jgi:hypothetical protein
MNPIELLQKELDVYKKALELSDKKFADGKIDAKLHETHVSNLKPKIEKYIEALRILKFYMD